MLFALLILLLGAKHPPPLNDITKLDTKRIMVGVLAFAVLIAAFVPIPMSAVVTDSSFEMTPMDDTNRTIVPGQLVVFEVLVQNTGNTKENISFEKVSSPTGWVVTFGEEGTTYSETYDMLLNVSGESVLTVMVESSSDSLLGNSSVTIGGTAVTSASEFNARMTFNLTVMTPEVELWVSDDGQDVLPGDSVVSHLIVNNTGEGDVNLTFVARDLPGLVAVLLYEDAADANSSGTLEAAVPASGDITVSIEVFVWASAEPGEKTVFIDVFYLSAHVGTVEVTFVVA
ncbi:MAG: hypothetical protein QG582_156 [Candidatus Thermoplasmatota archaeon]|nr:hypothetical protein [Candidatus Thermoplasmatota archaeon]